MPARIVRSTSTRARCIRALWRGLLTVVLLTCAGCSAPRSDAPAAAADPEYARLQAIADQVTIIRDDFGVPHVYAKTDADAVFGLLYAQAEDDFPRVERNYIWAIGRLAEVQGPEALYSDLRARMYMTREEAEAAYAAAPDWLQTLCERFADGLNWYLATHPDVKPALLTRFEPWMPFYFFEGSIGGDIEQIPLAGIEQFHARGRAVEADLPPVSMAGRTPMPAPPQVAAMGRNEFVEPVGSNGIAVSGRRTKSGKAMLLINPHTSFFFRGEVHVVSDEGLDAYGAVTWGQFFVYQGFNEDTGWMHTSTYVDFMDDFVEDVVKADDGSLKYVYGDELRPVEVHEVTLRSREHGVLVPHSFRFYRTHHGPITHALDGRWVATRINWDPVNALRQSYLRQKNHDYAQFRKMMDIRTNSSNNTVYADSSGDIAYFHGDFIPKRDPTIDYSKPVDGSDPGTDWQGLHTVDEIIHLHNPPNGWIENSNSTPFTAAGAYSPKREDYPRYMAPDEQNFRAIHGDRLLAKAHDLTLEGLIDLAYDPELPAFEQVIPGLVAAYDADPGAWPQLQGPIDALRDWDFQVGMDSVPMTLAHFYGLDLMETIEAPTALSRMDQFTWLGTQSDPADRLQVFARAVADLERDFGSWRTPWREVNRYQRLDGAIEQHFDDARPSIPVPMASGNWGALASFGAPRRDDTKRIYGRYGNSFVAVVEFGDRVRAKTILAGGQSGDPDSPHFDDQAQRYADVDFKDVAYYREDVEARAERTYHPGERPAP